MKRFGFLIILISALFLPLYVKAEDGDAQRLDAVLTASNGAATAGLSDSNCGTFTDFGAGSSLSIKVGEGLSIGGIYLKWYKVPGEWNLSYSDGAGNTSTLGCGRNGFLHEYVSIEDGGISECVMEFPSGASLCDVYVYSPGKLPSDVQTWKTAPDKVDMLVFSTHADDECLFLGGAIATYAAERNYRVQVVYMTNYWDVMIVREHEKLNGLWAMGVKYYPVTGFTPDEYVTTVEAAAAMYGKDKWTEFITQQIRRFKPQVVISQDFNGEYGHVAHILKADCVKEAVENSMKADFCPESASQYGTWDVPKTYYHLYWENMIRLNLRQPISALGGKTAIEAAADAYLCHESQQWCWFYVTDDPNDPKSDQINSAEYGLYRTTVGADTSNDMMEHITPYDDQDRLEEEARLEEEKRQAEEEKKAKREKKLREQELAREEALKKTKEPLTAGGIIALLVMSALLAAAAVVYVKDRRRRGI